MSCDYSAETYLGIEVSETDFFTTVTQTEVVCGHPEAESAKFCPECGLPEDQRTRQVNVDVWTDAMKPFIEAQAKDWGIEFDGVGWDDLCDECIINGLGLLRLKRSSEDREKGTLILGMKIHDVNGEGGTNRENPASQSWDSLAKNATDIIKFAAELGITKPLNFYTLCFASP